MNRPSKKDIKEAIEKLKENKPAASHKGELEQASGRPEPKKPNKNRIRKQGV